MSQSIFRTSSTERLSSPEQLNDYLRVSNPRVWILLAAAAILLVSFLIWGIFGKLPTTITVKGMIHDGKVIGFIEPDSAEKVRPGDTSTVNGTAYLVEDVLRLPLSYEESYAELKNDYARSMLVLSD